MYRVLNTSATDRTTEATGGKLQQTSYKMLQKEDCGGGGGRAGNRTCACFVSGVADSRDLTNLQRSVSSPGSWLRPTGNSSYLAQLGLRWVCCRLKKSYINSNPLGVRYWGRPCNIGRSTAGVRFGSSCSCGFFATWFSARGYCVYLQSRAKMGRV